MRKVISLFLLMFAWAIPALAQDGDERAWVQIEAHSTLAEAQDAARLAATELQDVNAFQLSSGWYALSLGPYSRDDAQSLWRELLRGRQIPRDSFVSDGRNYSQQIYPVGANTLTSGTVTAAIPATEPEPQATPTEEPAAVVVQAEPEPEPEETLAEARRNERDLTRDDRALIQEALQWEGFYTQRIDAAFGGGTRRAMADYQTAMGYEPTGVLTTRQRAELVDNYRAAFATLGLAQVDDVEAGIRITMPMGMVDFARYEPPFVHYDSTTADNMRVVLISMSGDQNTLFGLYEIMQSLEIVPLKGERSRDSKGFTISGKNDTLSSFTKAGLSGGLIKGYTVVWTAATDERLVGHVRKVMADSFEPYGENALDELLGEPGMDQSIDMMAGLEIRRPAISRSGVFLDGQGTVLTSADVLDGCARVTLDTDTDAEVIKSDAALGLALLKPKAAMSPMGVAAFKTGVPRLNSEVAVAGFPFGSVLATATMTFGTLADIRGLDGNEGVNRLTMETMDGDAGAPVLDATGAVVGVLLPETDGTRQLPADVSFAATVPTIANFLDGAGVTLMASEPTAQVSAERLMAMGTDISVLVSCWK